jgi:hypothetical protein
MGLPGELTGFWTMFRVGRVGVGRAFGVLLKTIADALDVRETLRLCPGGIERSRSSLVPRRKTSMSSSRVGESSILVGSIVFFS